MQFRRNVCRMIDFTHPVPKDSKMSIIYKPNPTNTQQYQTTVVYYCPSNLTLPQLISSNFSFDYSLSAGNVNNVTVVCDIDR